MADVHTRDAERLFGDQLSSIEHLHLNAALRRLVTEE